MLLETSFCGNKPIPTPSMDLDSPPRTDGPSQSSLQNRKNTAPRESSGMLSSDSSFENQKPQKLTALTTVQVHHHHIQDNSSSDPLQQFQPTPSPSGISESRAPPISSPDSPKSSDHWRPITPQELKSLSPRPTSPRPFRKDLSENQSTWTPPAARKNSTKESSPIQLTMTRNSSSSSPSKQHQQQAISSPAPKRKEIVQDTVSSSRSKQQQQQKQKLPAASKETDLFKSPSPRRKELPRSDAIDNSPRETPTTARKSSIGKSDSSGSSTKQLPKSKAAAAAATSTTKEKGGSGGGGGGGQSSSGKQFDEITTEMKFTEDPFVPVEDVPIEKKGFFRDDEDDDDDDELPYVPTTLPLEKSSVVPIIPIKERRKLATMVTTKPTQRPRCVRPPNPASLNDYIAYSSTASQSKSNNDSSASKSDASSTSTSTTTTNATTTTKMKINLPRDDSVPESPSDPSIAPKSRDKKKAPPTSWADFAEMGLRSPREIRRRMKMEENGASVNNTDETSAYQR